MDLLLENLRFVAQERNGAMIDFVRQLVAVPSLPGREGDVAGVIRQEMSELGYDEIWIDQAGNIIGKINGGHGPAVLLNGHMDHVDPGPNEAWPYPPYGATIVDGELWGRGSADMKGPVAAMIYAASLIKQIGIVPPGDVYVSLVVMEEVGGVGTQYLLTHLQAQAAICGEPSNNTLRRGHRGRVELTVDFKGRSAHASQPHLGLNPHYMAASFLSALPSIELAQDEALGSSTVAPTLYSTDQKSRNVIPEHVYLTLDWRNVPDESQAEILFKTQALLDACLAQTAPGQRHLATAALTVDQFKTYTGLEKELPSIFPSYLLAEDNRFLQAASAALSRGLGRSVGVDVWRFATDGGHLMAAGIPTVGYGPGDDLLAHTNQERVRLDQLAEAVVGYVILTLALADEAGKEPQGNDSAQA